MPLGQTQRLLPFSTPSLRFDPHLLFGDIVFHKLDYRISRASQVHRPAVSWLSSSIPLSDATLRQRGNAVAASEWNYEWNRCAEFVLSATLFGSGPG